jgi:hypothetical protein
MTQSLSLYWHRLTHKTSDDERAEAPVLDLAGCFGTPVTASVRPEALGFRPADAVPARPAPR